MITTEAPKMCPAKRSIATVPTSDSLTKGSCGDTLGGHGGDITESLICHDSELDSELSRARENGH